MDETAYRAVLLEHRPAPVAAGPPTNGSCKWGSAGIKRFSYE